MTLARACYEAYCKALGGVQPAWQSLTPLQQQAWDAAAYAVVARGMDSDGPLPTQTPTGLP